MTGSLPHDRRSCAVALLQVSSPTNEPRADRVARVAALLAQMDTVDLAVLPELWATGYFAFDRYDAEAEPLDGPTIEALAVVARSKGTWLLAGSVVERDPRGCLYNTSVLLDSGGQIAHSYRKVHLFGHNSRERSLLTAGESIAVASTPLGKLAVTTCYDLRFPELYRCAVDQGAEVFLVPSAWPRARADHWDVLTRARAIENQAYVVAVNGVGPAAGGVELAGRSRAVDPWGDVVTEAPDSNEATLLVTLDLDRVQTVRDDFPVLDDRRRTACPNATEPALRRP